jgi:hypothetical protein
VRERASTNLHCSADNGGVPELEKNVNDEFMLKEYESIAAAHFDSQAGLRQQFRFYLIVVAVPLTVLGFALNRPAGSGLQVKDIGLLTLPPLVSSVFAGIGFLGMLLSLAMIHTAFDSVLYARTVNGVRKYFADRALQLGVDLAPYFVMPTDKAKPHYFHFRAFFYQHILISFINAAYIWLGLENLHPGVLAAVVFFILFAAEVACYPIFAKIREGKQIAD